MTWTGLFIGLYAVASLLLLLVAYFDCEPEPEECETVELEAIRQRLDLARASARNHSHEKAS